MQDFDFSKRPGRTLIGRKLNNFGPPLISIITPFYNAGQYFMETVNSVLNQTFPYFEWLIVNDGSTRSEDISLLAAVEQMDPRIAVYHKENGGPSSARNLAIIKSNTEIIVPLDADDLIEPTYLECVYWSLYTNPDASWCYTDSVGFFGQEYLWKKPFNINQMKVENILTYAAGIRKKDLMEVGLQDEQHKFLYEDWMLWLKFLIKGKKAVHMNWYGFWYRRTDTGVLSKIKNDKDLQKKSRKLIRELSKQIKGKADVLEYPRYRELPYKKPETWEWDRPPVVANGKIKVLLLLPHMEMGGADLFNLDLLSRIDKEKFELSVITTNPAESTWRQRFEEHVTDLFDLTTFLDIDQWAAFICYFIRSRDVKIVLLSNSYYGYYLLPWLRKTFPDLVILDYVHSEAWFWRAGGYARTSGVMGDILDKTYVSSMHLKNVMVRHFAKDPERLEPVYIGVDELHFSPDAVEPGRARKMLGIGEGRPIVLFPCRIDLEKRPFLMFEIAKATYAGNPDIAFVVVGDGPLLNELQQAVKKHKLENAIYFAGRQSDLRPFYRDSSITLICSLKEGISLTTYESLAMGVPVISSDVGGQKELIDNTVGRVLPLYQDEWNDLHNRSYSEQEVEQYVKAIVEILSLSDDEADSIKSACRNRIVNSFTKSKMISFLETEFEAFANGKGNERRKKIAEAVQMLPNLIDDYLTMYIDYEVHMIHSNRALKFVKYLKEIVQLKKSPHTIFLDFKKYSNRYFVQRLIVQFKWSRSGRLLRWARNMTLRWLR
jgi:glycosyltransferase involved in cell wall biosynthesis